MRHESMDSWPSASSPPQADAPPTSLKVIPIREPIIPSFQYSIIPLLGFIWSVWFVVVLSLSDGQLNGTGKTLSPDSRFGYQAK